MRNTRGYLVAAVGAVLLHACGGGGSSSPTPPVTQPPARDGVVVLAGSIGGRFILSSSPVVHRDGTRFGCGDAEITIPYRETAGGSARGADYEIKILDLEGFARRLTGKADNLLVNPNATGTITVTERFVCVDYSPSLPPRAEVAMNFGGVAAGRVSQLAGVGPLSIVE